MEVHWKVLMVYSIVKCEQNCFKDCCCIWNACHSSPIGIITIIIIIVTIIIIIIKIIIITMVVAGVGLRVRALSVAPSVQQPSLTSYTHQKQRQFTTPYYTD